MPRLYAFLLLPLAALPNVARAADVGPSQLEEVTVTGTREAESLAETPASVKVISGEAVRRDKPTHPTEIMGQAPGVWVNVTGGEGHMTAIRQPLTTNPVYLYLEDGIPTRSTGFFNHNALYEINLPQAGGIEITKGPGSALYGSDAIGAVVNVLTRPAPLAREATASVEFGGYGWQRFLGSLGNTWGADGLRADLNLTRTDGWRDDTGYDRQSATLRWDRALDADALLKTVLTGSHIDQQTAGSSALIASDYENNPTLNYTPISYRKVSAVRLSSAYEREVGANLVSFTPYLRDNSMDLLPNWSLSYDPTVYTTAHRSIGLLAKWRRDFEPMRARLIVGADVDYSPGSREENRLGTLATSGSGVSKTYYGYTTGTRIYDYDVTFVGTSPYLQGELSPTERMRLTAGLRYDHLEYRFDNNFAQSAVVASTSENGAAPVARFYGQAADTDLGFDHLSPKLGVTYAIDAQTNAFASYNHAFRAPSEGQLFRPSAQTTAVRAQFAAAYALALQPVRADQYELGLRGKLGAADFQSSVYHLRKRDDILSYRDPVTNATQAVNAGETLHRGVELGLGLPMGRAWRADLAASYAIHTYEQWVIPGVADYSGKEMEAAPRVIGNLRLSWSPNKMQSMQLEWVKLGSYWMDQANTSKYGGYDLLNLRGTWALSDTFSLYGSVHNLLDKRYAESATVTSGTDTFAPGLPLTLFAGVEAKW
jgi:outer membrane receptor protein involved in Fe transport